MQLPAFSDLSYPAVEIEYAFARFFGHQLGDRTTVHDADVFRHGDPKDLAKLLDRAADRLDGLARGLSPATQQTVARAAESFRGIGKAIAQNKVAEPQGYHWILIGHLLESLAAVLEEAAAK